MTTIALLGMLLVLGPEAGAAPMDASGLATLVERGRYLQARAHLESSAAASPEDARLTHLLAELRLAFGDGEGALALVERAITLEPKAADHHVLCAEICSSLASRAGKLRALGLGRRAKRELETALSLAPGSSDALGGLFLFHVGAPGIVGADKDEARRLAESLARVDAARGHQARAILAELGDDHAAATRHYLAAATADPKSYEAQAWLAGHHAGAKRWAEAESAARAALALDAGLETAYSLLARVLAEQERMAELDATLAQSEREVPDDLAPHFTAASVFLRQGRHLDRAEALARRYLSQPAEGFSPSHAQGRRLLGLVLEKRGRVPEAVRELRESLRLEPTSSRAKKDLARLEKR